MNLAAAMHALTFYEITGHPDRLDDLKAACPLPYGYLLRRYLRRTNDPDPLRLRLKVMHAHWDHQEEQEIARQAQARKAASVKRGSRYPAWMREQVKLVTAEKAHSRSTAHSLVFQAYEALQLECRERGDTDARLPSETTLHRWISDDLKDCFH